MRWYVYEHQPLPDAGKLWDEAGWEYASFLAPSQSYLGNFLGQVEVVADPREADYYLFPYLVCITPGVASHFDRADAALAERLAALPWFRERPERHVVFLAGDDSRVPSACGAAVVFTLSCAESSRALPMYYFADPPHRPPRDIAECRWDVSFRGAVSTCYRVRSAAVAALEGLTSLRACCQPTKGYFHAAYPHEQWAPLMAEYLDLIDDSRFVLCPRGGGLASLRFFETLAWGRLPILISDDAKLPLPGTIPYADFTVRIPEAEVYDLEARLHSFLERQKDLRRCSQIARAAFENWFAPGTIGRFVETSLRESMASQAGPHFLPADSAGGRPLDNQLHEDCFP